MGGGIYELFLGEGLAMEMGGEFGCGAEAMFCTEASKSALPC